MAMRSYPEPQVSWEGPGGLMGNLPKDLVERCPMNTMNTLNKGMPI